MSAETRIPIASLRRHLDGARGRRHWKSLDELVDSAGFQEMLHREFPENAAEWLDPNGRRDFLKLMGASMALAGVTACTRQPDELIVPYVKAPEEIVPGRPLFFASAVSDRGYAQGVLVESHMGRPTKIEGNPEHPASLGATDARGQASVLDLYDPDRSRTLTHRGEIRAWGVFLAALQTALKAQQALQGEGLRILTGAVTSPTLAAQLDEVLAAYPKAKWHQWEPCGNDNAREGARLAFGEMVETRFDLERADVVLSLDSDFMMDAPSRLRDIRSFAARRRPRAGRHGSGEAHGAASENTMNRLYVVEAAPTLTGSNADHRLALRASRIEGFARALAAGLGLDVQGGEAHPWIAPLVADLRAHAGRSLVLVGESQPPAVHALAHLINQELGNVGATLEYTDPVEARPGNRLASLRELSEDMDAGRVDLLVVMSVNPVYDAPPDLRFGERMSKVPLRVHLGSHHDETGELCHWHVPEAHNLEAWGDLRAFDGTVSIVQPLIAPLYGGRSAHELLAAFGDRPERSGYEIVRDHWRGRQQGTDFERAWRKAVHDGLWADSALPARDVTAIPGEWARTVPPSPASTPELTFRPDPRLGDGRQANNGWLQELPETLSKLTWGNAALVGPATAEALGIEPARLTSAGSKTPLVELTLGEGRVTLPAWVMPGVAEGSVVVWLGHGRKRAGQVGNGTGVDVYPLRRSQALWFAPGAQLSPTGDTTLMASTQDHWSLDPEASQEAERRHLVRSAPITAYLADPHVLHEGVHQPDPSLDLYPPHEYAGHAWGMTIDLSSCVGCNACVTACQSENNIPVVGKDQVARGREMQWIRIDRYYEGGLDAPEVHHQPVPCMHCESAPCEVVCPVAATVHSDEGLNDMVYNRCVGTRYCSNNCPYKVRRFNFYLYQDWDTPSLKLQRNPDVTVRSRGVMEKCTYCVQRINQARNDAKVAGREIRDGEIRTACQQACPAQAIVFGDVNDAGSAVSHEKASPRNYALLGELNTKPRTTYLGAVKNPNPEMPRG